MMTVGIEPKATRLIDRVADGSIAVQHLKSLFVSTSRVPPVEAQGV